MLLPSMIVYSARDYDRHFFQPYRERYTEELGIHVKFVSDGLNTDTLHICQGATVVCLFVNDVVDKAMAQALSDHGIKLIVLRCAGTNNIDLEACQEVGIDVRNVPDYGPNSISEHALSLMLSLNRKLHIVNQRTKFGDFSLNCSLLGFEMKGKTVGVIGTGRIGKALIWPLLAMKCKVLCYDIVQDPELQGVEGLKYVPLDELLSNSRVVSLHLPLRPETNHIIDARALQLMPTGSILINTSRGGLVDTKALIHALKDKDLAGAGLDVYEAEAGVFYRDLSMDVLKDDQLARLLSFNNVLVTCHQGYFTEEAMQRIAASTFDNVAAHFAK